MNENFAEGSALLEGNALYIGFNFEISAAPKMRLYLSQHVTPYTKEDLFGQPTIDLGPLQSLYGVQEYPVRSLTDEEWNRYRTVAVYSESLKQVIALAQIRKRTESE